MKTPIKYHKGEKDVLTKPVKNKYKRRIQWSKVESKLKCLIHILLIF